MINPTDPDTAIRNLVARIASTIDTRAWQDLRALFADQVTTDYTSLFGGEVQRQSGDDLIAGWHRLLSPLDATQHLLGAVAVQLDNDLAVADCHVRGYHVRHGAPGGPEWLVAGRWVIELRAMAGGWRITSLTLQTFYQTGNRNLLSEVASM